MVQKRISSCAPDYLNCFYFLIHSVYTIDQRAKFMLTMDIMLLLTKLLGGTVKVSYVDLTSAVTELKLCCLGDFLWVTKEENHTEDCSGKLHLDIDCNGVWSQNTSLCSGKHIHCKKYTDCLNDTIIPLYLD